MEPFEPGLALTVGIAYRRALLSAIHGAAPTWVKIEHVLHEFSHLPGVTEDTLDIMMNLRKVVFVLHVNRPKILRLKAQGAGTVKGSDCEKDADIEILTPEVPLATLGLSIVSTGVTTQPCRPRLTLALPLPYPKADTLHAGNGRTEEDRYGI